MHDEPLYKRWRMIGGKTSTLQQRFDTVVNLHTIRYGRPRLVLVNALQAIELTAPDDIQHIGVGYVPADMVDVLVRDATIDSGRIVSPLGRGQA